MQWQQMARLKMPWNDLANNATSRQGQAWPRPVHEMLVPDHMWQGHLVDYDVGLENPH